MRADRLDEAESLASGVRDDSWPVGAPVELHLGEWLGVRELLTTLNHRGSEPRFLYFGPTKLLHDLLEVKISLSGGEFLRVVQEAGGWSVLGIVRPKYVRPESSAHVLEADPMTHLRLHSARKLSGDGTCDVLERLR